MPFSTGRRQRTVQANDSDVRFLDHMNTVFAIIVAAGSGKRMKRSLAKQYIDIDGTPILSKTLAAFDSHPEVGEICLVIPAADMDFCRERILGPGGFTSRIHLVAGGERRQDSVVNGLSAISARQGIVLIHDGVRPFVTHELISACISGAAQTGACIAAIPASDTIKQGSQNGRITATLSRDALWLAQTPQAFDLELLRKANAYAEKLGFSGTDDASLVEHLGHPVAIVSGSSFNIKITTPDDLLLARGIIYAKRTGNKKSSKY